MRYYLGVDGGGSKTTALICDETGARISSFFAGGINYNAIGIDAARENLRAAVAGALGGRDIPLSSACIGCAALDGPADAALTERLCGGVIPCDHIILDSDVGVALAAMDTEGGAAIAICGTGSMAAGRDRDGRIIHTGGYGYLIGDEGSGFAVARQAVGAGLRCFDKSGPATMLTDRVFAFYNAESVPALLDTLYKTPFTPGTVAAFAPEVLRCAEEGDAVASSILKDQAKGFAETVKALLRKLPENAPLGLWGGMFQHHESYAALFSEYVKKDFPGCRVGLLPNPPEYGAVLAAMRTESKNG